MSAITRSQDYKYQYKTVSAANVSFCSNPSVAVTIPENILDIKAIYMHIVLQFTSGTDSAHRKIKWVGGEYPLINAGTSADPANGNMAYVNKSADPTTRIVDVKKDITHLKDAILVAAQADTGDLFRPPTMQLSMIIDEVLSNFSTYNIGGTILLWKIDFVYTTKGIQ